MKKAGMAGLFQVLYSNQKRWLYINCQLLLWACVVVTPMLLFVADTLGACVREKSTEAAGLNA